jgi:hypothetical protein
MNTMRVLVALGLLFGSSVAVARAESAIVVVGGSATERDRGTVGQAVETALRGSGWSVLPTRLAKKEADGLLHCKDAKAPWTCIPKSIGAAVRVMVVQVENAQASNGAPMVVITGQLIAPDVQATTSGQHYCEQCADDKLIDGSAGLVTKLVRELVVRVGRTNITVRSVPSGATVMLDAQPAGLTDGTFNTYPGSHLVIIELPGYHSETKNITVEEGKTADVAVTLRRLETGTVHEGHRSRLVPGLIGGAGLVAVVVGISVSATANPPSKGPAPEYVYSGPGIAIAVGGGVAVGVAAYLWFRAGKAPPKSAPTGSVVPGGAVFGWSTRF